MGVEISTILRHYKRPEIQKAIVESAIDREVSVRFPDGSFGKRPDALLNPNDVLEHAKQRASSFHCSEEIWVNPLQISTGMRRDDIERLRKGWDLVLDIDCPYWELSKLTTWLFIEALKSHGVKSISLKFSGNKGFHIGVPFKSFPTMVPGKDILTKTYFPEGPRRIAKYLLDYIEKHFVKVEDNYVTFGKTKLSFDELKKITGKTIDQLTYKVVKKGLNEVRVKDSKDSFKHKNHYHCASCGTKEIKEELVDYIKCNMCGSIVTPLQNVKEENIESTRKFDSSSIIEVDTILIASRHLYRSIYSLHEKSGLVSVPIPIDDVLNFRKADAMPTSLKVSGLKFLDDSETIPGEADKLLKEAFDHNPIIETEEDENKLKRAFNIRNYDETVQEIPEDLFPPCVKLMLKGLKDGKKRTLFILLNFLTSAGWSYEKIEERLHEWNKLNYEPLRETLIKTHISYHKLNKKKILPPNCPSHTNAQYYRDMGLCHPDSLCRTIKNPVQYAKKRAWIINQEKPRRKKKEVIKEKKAITNNEKM